MSPRHPGGRLKATLLSVALTLATLTVIEPKPASAEPGTGGEGATPTLAQVLEQSTVAWLEAKAKLEASTQRQAQLTIELQATEQELAKLTEQVSSIAVAAYQTGGLTTAAAVIGTGTPNGFVERATSITAIARHNDRQLHRLNELKKQQAAAKAAIDAEVVTQREQLDLMARKKAETEKALALAGGKANGFVSATSPAAVPAPRGPNGSWPKESCVVDDPTTTGCVTARTLHALKQAQAAGFRRFVSCYRPGGPYEHPKGRACDFSAQVSGFGGVAAGEDRVYGSNLAAYLVRNADRLGVLYVIWFKQVWTPAAGWHYYGGAGGDPSSDHTNHVHLSMI